MVNMNRTTAQAEPVSSIDLNTLHTNTPSWASNGAVFWQVPGTVAQIPAGMYVPGNSQQGPFLTKIQVAIDDLVSFEDSVASRIVEEFTKFWKLEPKFRSRGFLMKRGFLISGPPGGGKTSCLRLLSQRIIKDHDGIVILGVHHEILSNALQMVRRLEPNRKILCLLEDFDAMVDSFGEAGYLALLDGETQIDNIFFVATTNYLDKLDVRFRDRPSRFDTLFVVDMPNEAARHQYFEAREPSLTPAELAHWVRTTDGLSIAHCKELIIAVKCFGQDFDEVMSRLRGMDHTPYRKTGGMVGSLLSRAKPDGGKFNPAGIGAPDEDYVDAALDQAGVSDAFQS